jgi:hypothetical protein
LLSRLHHVSNPQLLRARFRELAGPDMREYSVGGYEILLIGQATPRRPDR